MGVLCMNKEELAKKVEEKITYVNLDSVEKVYSKTVFEKKNAALKELTKKKKEQRKSIQFDKMFILEKLKQQRHQLVEKKKSISHLKLHKSLYPFLRIAMAANTKLSLQKYNIIGDGRTYKKKGSQPNENRPKIFVVTHIGKCDIEIVMQALKEHSILLSADEDLLINTVDGLFLSANGYVGIDHKDLKDGKNSLQIIKNTIKSGYNVMIFSEGIWNVSDNCLVEELFYGALSASFDTNALLVPVAINQIDKKFKVNIGQEIDVLKRHNSIQTKKQILDELRIELRDALATLKWYIYESNDRIKRSSIPENYREQFLYKIFKEYAWFDEEEINSRLYKEKNKSLEQKNTEQNQSKYVKSKIA